MSRLQFAVATYFHFLFVPLTVGLSLLVAIMETSTSRRARTIEMKVDGHATEWNELGRVPKANLSAGFVNDDEALYVCVSTSDENARRQILGQGLMVWLDVQGGQKERIGIRFPAMSRPTAPGGPDDRGGPPERGGGPPLGDWGGSQRSSDRPESGRRQPPGDMDDSAIPPEAQRRVEILGQKDSDRRVVLLGEAPGLDAHVGIEEGVLVWEARLPIAKTRGDLWPFVAAPGVKERRQDSERLAAIPGDQERVLLGTDRYIGEGFDDPRLDTLFVTLPVSWRGTIAQYVGRLHRLHDGKRDVRVYDCADLNVPMLARMFERRCRGYEAVGYSIALPASAHPGWPADVVLPTDPLWKHDYAPSVRRLIRDGVDSPLAELFVGAARPILPDAEGALSAEFVGGDSLRWPGADGGRSVVRAVSRHRAGWPTAHG